MNIYYFLISLIIILLFLNRIFDRKIQKPKRKPKTLHRQRQEEYRRYLKRQRQEEYRRYLKTDHWKVTRAEALKRGHYKCHDCGSTTNLQVHHLTYARRGHERQSDLVVVCDKCHKKRHGIKH